MPSCPICSGPVISSPVTRRSGTSHNLHHCSHCNFSFFSYDPSSSLSAGHLESTRLGSVGLNIPNLDEDLSSTLKQAELYCETYNLTTSPPLKILDFGCSTGAFLRASSSYGHKTYGIELNKLKCQFVNSHLSIPCFESLLDLPKHLSFDRIFLFYSIEYVLDFKGLLINLFHLLSPGGSLILHTPNLNDPLLDYWNIESFSRFFYDDHSVNYFSVSSLEILMRSIDFTDYSLTTHQGYSLFNHLNWLFNARPSISPFVGSDLLSESLHDKLLDLAPSNPVRSYIQTLVDLDNSYKDYLSVNRLGNNIILHLSKLS